MCVVTCIYIYIYVYVDICIYIYIYISAASARTLILKVLAQKQHFNQAWLKNLKVKLCPPMIFVKVKMSPPCCCSFFAIFGNTGFF